MSPNVKVINALAEFERAGIDYEPAGDDEVRLRCPAPDHLDEKPSASLNVVSNKWLCHAAGCDARGDVVTLLALHFGVERATMLADLGTRYDLEVVRTIAPSRIEKCHEKIWKSGPLLKALKDRGLTDPMIRAARLGVAKGRITIPVYDQQGRVVNVRRYLPGAPGSEKMRNTSGYGKPRIYQLDQLTRFDRSLWCGGEMKALVAGWYLKKRGVGAWSVTASEGVWNHKWAHLVQGKTIIVCMDVDDHGVHAAQRAAAAIHAHAERVLVATLPLDRKEYPKGDINDWVGAEGARTKELLQLIEDAVPFEPSPDMGSGTETKAEAIEVNINDVTDPRTVARRITFVGVVSALHETPFLVPQVVAVVCDKTSGACQVCPVNAQTNRDPKDGSVRMTVSPTAMGLLSLVDVPATRLREGLMTSLRIPHCKSVQFVPISHSRIRDVRLAPTLSITSEGANNHAQPALIVDCDVELNTPYRFDGVTYPHPSNQQAVLLVSGAEQAEDSLQTFEPSPESLNELVVFQPPRWTDEALEETLDRTWTDIETNVTRIFKRRPMHVVFDLAYHSPLVLTIDGRETPGWVNALIVGDSGHGKSATAIRLTEHYGLGERVEMKNATVAGLLGGLSQIGNRWFVQWGVIPTHDRRLVVLEEVKGADVEVIARLTDMRSSGVAELQKIERRRAHARTRLVMISNPRGSRPLDAFNFGIEAIQELIGGLEDIRRFDVAVLVSMRQVDVEQMVLLAAAPSDVEHRASRELCRRLILWSWTRRPDQVRFTDDAWDELRDGTLYLCRRFSEALPLIDRGTTRLKLARLSASLAVRSFSCDADPTVVVVRGCHVRWVVRFLDDQYSDPIFGYLDFSRAQVRAEEVVDPDVVRRQLLGTKYPADFVASLLFREEITAHDIEDWCEVDYETARRMLSLLVRKRAAYRHQRSYRKTAQFIELLKKMETEGVQQEAQVHEDEEF